MKKKFIEKLEESPAGTLAVISLLAAAPITPPDVLSQLVMAVPIFVVMYSSHKVYESINNK